MQEDPIRNVYESIERASEALPELSQHAGFALRTISASAGRASLPGRRLSASARLSIACAAMSFAAAALSAAGPRAASQAAAVVRAAAALNAGPATPEHEVGADEGAPEGWEGGRGGPFAATAPCGASLALTRRPHLPGGDWTVHYEGLPLAFGKTAASAARRGAELAALLSSPPGKVPPAPARLSARRKP